MSRSAVVQVRVSARAMVALALLGLGLTAPTAGASPQLRPLAVSAAPAPVPHAGAGRATPACTFFQGNAFSTYAAIPVVGGSIWGVNTTHTAGYCGTSNASWPRIGDVFYVGMYVGVANPGGEAPSMALWFDNQFTDAEYAISAANPVRCFYSGAPDPANCSQTPGPSLTGTGHFFGGRAMAGGTAFEVQVPIIVKRPKSGIATGNAALFGQSASTALGGNAVASQWLFVADRPNELVNPVVSGVSTSGARTQADIYSFWRAGELTFELGTAAGTYELGSQTIALDGTLLGGQAWADWTNLAPGRTFHWRARFTGAPGVSSVTLPDQVFTTSGTNTGGPPTTGNTVPVKPQSGGTGGAVDTAPPGVALGQPACGSRTESKCKSWRKTRAAWKTLAGTTSDASGVAGVEVALRLKAGSKCRWWRGAKWVTVGCNSAPAFVPATVTSTGWRLALKRAIPAGGKLRVQLRATDRAGNRSAVTQSTVTVK